MEKTANRLLLHITQYHMMYHIIEPLPTAVYACITSRPRSAEPSLAALKRTRWCRST